MDASYLGIFLKDLGRALHHSNFNLQPHIDYKIWADSYFSLRTSLEAKVSTSWHVKRLRNLQLHRKALFPPAQMSRGATDGSTEHIDFSFVVPGLRSLRLSHPQLTAPVVFKAAMALWNICNTGHTHALFCNFEAGRTGFPFIPESVSALTGLDGWDVAGPTFEVVINLIEVRKEETVIDFLDRLQKDQDQLTRYSHAPWHGIMDALGTTPDGTGAGDMLPAITRTQILSWAPPFDKAGGANLEVIKFSARPVVGLDIVARLAGADSSTIMFSMWWDVTSFSREWAQETAACLQELTCWLTESVNWYAPVGDFESISQ